MAEWEKRAPIVSSYSDFTDEMRKIFDHPVRSKEASKRLFSLRQGPRSVAEFAVEFRCLAKPFKACFTMGLTITLRTNWCHTRSLAT